MPMHLRHVAYGGCWKCPQLWQRCSSTTPRLAASQNGLVHSFGTGIGRVTLPQSLIYFLSRLRRCAGNGIGGSSGSPAGVAVLEAAAEHLASSSVTILRI